MEYAKLYQDMILSRKKALLLVAWFLFSNFLALLTFGALIFYKKESPEITYSIFESNPLVAGEIGDVLGTTDSRAETIDQYFAKYKCPLHGTGKKMVELADKYKFDYWWLAAIAWQESTCGKQIIEGSYNAWGYGIYGDKVTRFDSWDSALEQVALDLNNHYFSKGLLEPCDVEEKYTPPSNGSWCRSIKYFRDEMASYKTP